MVESPRSSKLAADHDDSVVPSPPMTPAEFLQRLDAASDQAILFARECVVDTVPDARLFDIAVKPHHDGSVDPPLDALYRRSRGGVLRDVTREAVVAELWHDGRVPEWIDISVKEVGAPPDDEWGMLTFIELRCSRTIASDDALWYAPTGVAPFHVVGPTMPTWSGDGWNEPFRR